MAPDLTYEISGRVIPMSGDQTTRLHMPWGNMKNWWVAMPFNYREGIKKLKGGIEKWLNL